jgi:hypothetical protein
MEQPTEINRPRLAILNGSAWEIILIPLALEAGLPTTVTFKTQVRLGHSTGEFEYTADDLTFMPKAFSDFAEELHKLLNDALDRCVFSAIGDELRLTFRRLERKKLTLEIRVKEVQINADPAELILSTIIPDYDSLDRIQRWVSTFSKDLNRWVEEEGTAV